jgi:hypothetical protein
LPIKAFDFSKHSPLLATKIPNNIEFISRTKITMPYDQGAAQVPFTLWPEQQRVLSHLETDRLVLLLKARQIGMTWLTCAYVLAQCMQHRNRTALMFSQGLREAIELIDRVRLLYLSYKGTLPTIVADNASGLEWSNGSRIRALPATRRAGRSFTASIVVLDEYAFMQWGAELMAAVKPTIDGGGQLIVLSSADGNGTLFHRFWQAAKTGTNGFTPLFLDWRANPDRDDGWREARKAEGLSEGDVLREYPANDLEAFIHASGLVYDVWSDGPSDGNVSELAEFTSDGGPIYWACDDGYSGSRDDKTGLFTADSHPRVFLLAQERADGRLCIFHEDYRVKALSDQHIANVLALGYPEPEYVALDSSAAELRGRLQAAGLYVRGKPARIDESIKALRRMLAPDANGWRRITVHPRCKHLRAEMASYRYDPQTEQPVKQFDHGPDALRYFAWTKRLED